MFKVFKAYNIKDTIKAAGGKWNSYEKCWMLTQDQYATLPAETFTNCKVIAPRKRGCDIPLVPLNHGDTFRVTSTYGVYDGCLEVVTDKGTVAVIECIETKHAHNPNSSYGRHRICKGEDFYVTHEYFTAGPVAEIIESIRKQLPQCLIDSGFSRSSTNDEWGVYQFLLELVAKCGFYGNTPKHVIAAIKKYHASKPQYVFA
jgi:hypothetical protein